MPNDDEIFNTYAIKRIREDESLGINLYLDDVDSHLARSASLDYLSHITGVELRSVSPKWMTEESTSLRGQDYYRDETDRNLVIDVRDVVDVRAKNIENIVQKLSPDLAQKILAFEEATKYLKTPALSSEDTIKKGFNKAVLMLPKNVKDKIEDKVLSPISDPVKKSYEVRNKAKRKRFYELLKQVYQPHDLNEQQKLWEDLLEVVGAHDPNDIGAYVNGGQGRINAELRRDVAVQIKKLNTENRRFEEAQWWQQEINAYSKTIDRYLKYSRHSDMPYARPFGPNGAFEKGGLYGPDSRFAGVEPQNESVLKTKSAEPIAKESVTPKKEEYIQTQLFNDKDFEY